MRHPAAVLVALLVAACSKAPAPRSDAGPADPAAVDFLLTSAATDFHTHGPPGPVRVRDVRLGRVPTPDGGDQYLLCGQYLPAGGAGTAEWTPFVTIRTSGYEQYIGAQADVAYCQPASVTWVEQEGDLSTMLQGRIDSLRPAGSQAPPP